MKKNYKMIRGGFCIGSGATRWPFCKLYIYPDKLQIEAPFFSAILCSDEVIGLVKHRGINGKGCIICHTSRQIPIPIIFSGSCDDIDQAIKATEFECRGIGSLDPHISKAQEQDRLSLFLLLLVMAFPLTMFIYMLFK